MSEPRRALVALVAVCAAVSVCAGAGSASSVSPVGGKLVLVRGFLSFDDDAHAGLWVMNADGSGLRQITHGSSDEQPHWSPDGRSIAFLRGAGRPGRVRVMVVRSDGSAPRVLGSDAYPNLEAPNPWSPDGKRIAWGGCKGLCLYDLASSRLTRIPLGGRPDQDGYAWSPDGRKLAAVDQFDGLVVLGRSGKKLAFLAKTGSSPAWSPGGKQIAFLAGHKLELVGAAGGPTHVVATNAYSGPSWSADGRRLLYLSDVGPSSDYGVHVLNAVTHTNTRVADSDGIIHWSPAGTMIAYGLLPTGDGTTGQDIWLARANGGGVRQLTGEFPTGLGFSDLDWTSGSVAAGPPPSPPVLLQLEATNELRLDYLYRGDITRAGTSDSVVYGTEELCDAQAETTSEVLNVWTPSTGATVTTSNPCQDFGTDAWAVTPNLDAWLSQSDLDGNQTLAVMRPGTTRAPPLTGWTSGEESPDIGWRSTIGQFLVSDGSTLLFDTKTSDGSMQLWRIADGFVPHAVQIPLPPDATDPLDEDAGRIAVGTGKTGLVVLNTTGTVLARIPYHGTTHMGGGLLGVATANTLRVYDASNATLRYQLPLAHASGVPQLLTLGAAYAVYTSGIELHLLRLDNGNDQIVDLPRQDGDLEALLTTDGLFIGYQRGYDTQQPARLLFVPAANLP